MNNPVLPLFPMPSWRSHGQIYSLLYLTERSVIIRAYYHERGLNCKSGGQLSFWGFYALSQSLETKAVTFLQMSHGHFLPHLS